MLHEVINIYIIFKITAREMFPEGSVWIIEDLHR